MFLAFEDFPEAVVLWDALLDWGVASTISMEDNYVVFNAIFHVQPYNEPKEIIIHKDNKEQALWISMHTLVQLVRHPNAPIAELTKRILRSFGETEIDTNNNTRPPLAALHTFYIKAYVDPIRHLL